MSDFTVIIPVDEFEIVVPSDDFGITLNPANDITVSFDVLPIDGEDGDNGNNGWSPEFAIVNDGARRVVQLVGWHGGEGLTPTIYVGWYVGPAGMVEAIASAVDIRGPQGTAGIGSGDMLASVYDPTGVGADAFDWNNFINIPVTFAPSAHTHEWGEVTGAPTTLAGYGITDAAPATHVGSGGTSHAVVVASGNAGFMSGTDKAKLNGIEAAADVTDAGNVGSAINGAAAKGTPADADKLPLLDSTAFFGLKNFTWANLKAALGSLNVATQADMEAAASNTLVVTPGRQHFHPGHPKCWLYATVPAGTPAIVTSYNIASIVDTGSGVLTVNIATDFSSAAWCPLVSTFIATSAGDNITTSGFNLITAGSIILRHHQLDISSNAEVATDPDAWAFVGFGDQA